MTHENLLKTTLLDAADSVLVLVDVQKVFANKLATAERDPILERIGWIVDVAVRLEIPIVAMGEDIKSNGKMIDTIKKKLPKNQVIHNKMVFGLTGEQEILTEIKRSGRNQAILVGFETDVCVAHSALGLLDYHFHVAVLADATGSPRDGHANGLRRMMQAGILISDVKSLYYEWMRTVAADDAFKANFLAKIGTPTGLDL